MTDSEAHISILLDIKEDIGALNAQMMAANRELLSAAEAREELKRGQIETREALKPVVKNVSDLRDDVDKLQIFEGHVSSYIWAGGLIVSGILFFLWKGIDFFASDIKAWVWKLFH